jgi:hypothetical protein
MEREKYSFNAEFRDVNPQHLQTLTEISTEKNSTIIFPLPMELASFLSGREKKES